jgi:hypothetical protein
MNILNEEDTKREKQRCQEMVSDFSSVIQVSTIQRSFKEESLNVTSHTGLILYAGWTPLNLAMICLKLMSPKIGGF